MLQSVGSQRVGTERLDLGAHMCCHVNLGCCTASDALGGSGSAKLTVEDV